jgi:hypothetical protein
VVVSLVAVGPHAEQTPNANAAIDIMIHLRFLILSSSK